MTYDSYDIKEIYDNYDIKESGISRNYVADKPWDLNSFKQNLEVEIISFTPGKETLEFDIKNIDCTFANALRRIITSEVPAVAFDRIYIHQNTGIMADEILAHRIGLLPINVNPNLMKIPTCFPNTDNLEDFDEEEHLVFDLDVKNLKKKTGENIAHKSIYSSDFKWTPLGDQVKHFGNTPPTLSKNKILLTKIGVGDEIKARCIAVRGIGRDHAKFETISCCYYKFYPQIELTREFDSDLAVKLKESFAKGVIDIDPITGTAYVKNSRLDNGSREYQRHEEFLNDNVRATINPNHVIFYVEVHSPDVRSPEVVVQEAIQIMVNKTEHYLQTIRSLEFLKDITPDSVLHVKEDEFNSKFPIKSETEPLCGRDVSFEIVHLTKDLVNGTFKFIGEDHTLGGALRHCILQLPSDSFCGYSVPHPLEDTILINIQNGSKPAHVILMEGLELLDQAYKHLLYCYHKALASYRNH